MPRRTMKKRAYRKKPAYKRRGGQRTTLVNTSLNPTPARFITKHKYAQAVTTGTAGLNTYRFNLNSLYDPDRTGLGHQPYGYDQIGILYNRYRVISCKYVLSAISTDANIAVAVLPSNDAAPPITNVSEARENPRGKYIVQNPGGTLKVLKGNVYLPALTGRTKTQYMSGEQYQAQTGSSPTELMTLNCYAQGLNDDPAFNPAPTFNILLEYTVEWFDPINQDQS